jgi:mannose/cellobiose epimerase-like protein (N-acyl-D-glucosamine 2-epimerase family)
MKYFTHSLRILGTVEAADPDLCQFRVRCRSGDVFDVYTAEGTGYFFIRNLDNLDRDRVPIPEGYQDTPQDRIRRYIHTDWLVSTYGIYQEHDGQTRFDAREVWLFQSENGNYLFEETHWWIGQITALADQWLFNLFGTAGEFDYSKYQTNLTFIGSPTPNPLQECATLARLIYGLSSAYIMTGNRRYYDAARAGVEYQRVNFRTESHDGSFVVWAHAYDAERERLASRKIIPSLFEDDLNAIPLYEQIYALAGLAQFYRISNDWETLADIERSLNFFDQRFQDPEFGGYYSHIDPVTFLPDTPSLGDNRAKKNWNSIGDHTPAYLLNVILALDIESEPLRKLRDRCLRMQGELANLIVEKFPEPDAPYVRERFHRDWTPDLSYKWQQDRAVVGHNLKIAWNLTRVWALLGKEEYLELARRLGRDMVTHGLDLVRGGCFDVVERKPGNGMPFEFTWHNRKAFWQQEQAILAYLILYGATRHEEFLQLARDCIAFWNMTFLDLEHHGVYFDVTDDGFPALRGVRALKGSHSMSGYHVFELSFLAQLYIRTFVTKTPFRLYFRPCPTRQNASINVMPDYLPAGSLQIGRVFVNGEVFERVDRDDFRVHLEETSTEVDVAVEFIPAVSQA